MRTIKNPTTEDIKRATKLAQKDMIKRIKELGNSYYLMGFIGLAKITKERK